MVAKKMDESKVCVVCRCAHLGSSYADDFNIFIIGIGSSDSDSEREDRVEKKIEPNIRVRGFGESAASLCYLNSESTLYVFEDEKLCVYTYELGEGAAAKSNFILEKSMVEKSPAPPMNTLKYGPRGIPTPDGKMLVFSTKILFHYPEYLIDDHRELNNINLRDRGESESDVDEFELNTIIQSESESESDVELEPMQSDEFPRPLIDEMYPDEVNPDVDRYGMQDNVNHSHLEVFDPARQLWEKLPQLMIRVDRDDDNYVVKDANSDSWIKLPFKCCYGYDFDLQDRFNPVGGCFTVNACSFISSSTLLLHVSLEPELGQFLTFDMRGGGLQPYQGWIPAAIDPPPRKFLVVRDLVYFSASDGYICCTDHNIPSSSMALHPYPESSSSSSSVEMEDATATITLLDDCRLVRVRGGKHPKTWESSLLLDVLNWDGERLHCRASYHLPLQQISKSFRVVETSLLTN